VCGDWCVRGCGCVEELAFAGVLEWLRGACVLVVCESVVGCEWPGILVGGTGCWGEWEWVGLGNCVYERPCVQGLSDWAGVSGLLGG
jgi:hypothetical protein